MLYRNIIQNIGLRKDIQAYQMPFGADINLLFEIHVVTRYLMGTSRTTFRFTKRVVSRFSYFRQFKFVWGEQLKITSRLEIDKDGFEGKSFELSFPYCLCKPLGDDNFTRDCF